MPKRVVEISSPKNSFFIHDTTHDILPLPPIFKHGFNGKPFFVPKYFPFEHSETQWILNMFKSESWERLQRVALINPFYFTNSYYQVPDNPEPKFGRPMLHNKVVMYLTPFALALYLNLSTIVENLLKFRDQRNKKIIDINQPLYLTNVFVKSKDNINDLMKISAPSILILRESLNCISSLLLDGKWRPLKPFSFLYRRPFKICKFSYKDIIDYALSILISKTSLKIPFLFHSMIDSLSDEFSLLYYEQTVSQFRCNNVEEWVSIPRRLLRFAFYYDKDMRLTGQLLRCVQVFQKNSFFFGPTKSCFEIGYQVRQQLLEHNFNKKIGDPDSCRVVMDQDCCLSLLFGLMAHSDTFKHTITKENLLNVISSLAADTMWLLHFLVKRPSELSKYFSNLIEKVGNIPENVFIQLKRVLIKQIEINTIPIFTIKDLRIKPHETVPVGTAIAQFSHMYSDMLGYLHPELMSDNYPNQLLSDSESSERAEEDELERLIKSQLENNDCGKLKEKKDICEEVIRFLESESEF